MGKCPNREEALALLKRYNESDALIKHGMAVESVMRHYAEKYGEDIEKWGVTGLLHDLDYEKYPDQHCVKVREILQEEGIDEEIIRAVASHGWGICSDLEPQSLMEKTLYTVDELTGLVNAAVLMRPDKSVMNLEVKSLKKKFKSKSFAAGVDREIIKKGCEMLNLELSDVMEDVILGMRASAEELGLAGEI